MPGLNKVMVIGNVGQDPEMRFTPNGVPVANFSVACNRKYTPKDGEARDETEWFRVVAWNKTAEIVNQYVKKGDLIYVEGRQQTREWEDQDGQPRKSVELVADRVLMLGGKPKGEAPAVAPGSEDALPDLPFS